MFLPLSDDTPRLGAPVATVFLMGVCVMVFLYTLTLDVGGQLQLARAAGVVPWEIRHVEDLVAYGHPRDVVPPPLTVLTSMFVHGDALHLTGNLWFLWVFGSRIEGYMGWPRYLLFLALAQCIAATMQVAVAPDSTTPMIGASGAIAGVLGAYALSFPRAQVRCLVLLFFFVTFVELPALLLLGLWFVGQFISVGGSDPGVAWYAHIGGFLTGALVGRSFMVAGRVVYFAGPWQRRWQRRHPAHASWS